MHTTQEARTTMAEIGSSITPQQRAAALKAIPSHAKKAQTLLDGYFQNSLSGERFKAMAKQALEKLDALHAFDLGVRGADPKDELRLHVLGITYGEVLPIGLGKTQAYTRAFTARVRTPAIARAAIRFPTGAFSLSEMRLDWIYNFALNATKYVMATSLDLPAPTLAVLQTIVDNAGAHFGPTEQLFAHWALAAGIQHGRSEGRAIHVTERIMMTSASNPLFGRVMAHNREVVRLGPLGMQEASAAPCVRLALPVIIAECENNVGRAENAPANALIINMS